MNIKKKKKHVKLFVFMFVYIYDMHGYKLTVNVDLNGDYEI